MSSYMALEADILSGVYSLFPKAHFLPFTFSLTLELSIFVPHDVTI